MATRGSGKGSSWRSRSTGRPSIQHQSPLAAPALRCRRKFLRFFPGGFDDETYVDWERDYKWQAHER